MQSAEKIKPQSPDRGVSDAGELTSPERENWLGKTEKELEKQAKNLLTRDRDNSSVFEYEKKLDAYLSQKDLARQEKIRELKKQLPSARFDLGSGKLDFEEQLKRMIVSNPGQDTSELEADLNKEIELKAGIEELSADLEMNISREAERYDRLDRAGIVPDSVKRFEKEYQAPSMRLLARESARQLTEAMDESEFADKEEKRIITDSIARGNESSLDYIWANKQIEESGLNEGEQALLKGKYARDFDIDPVLVREFQGQFKRLNEAGMSLDQLESIGRDDLRQAEKILDEAERSKEQGAGLKRIIKTAADRHGKKVVFAVVLLGVLTGSAALAEPGLPDISSSDDAPRQPGPSGPDNNADNTVGADSAEKSPAHPDLAHGLGRHHPEPAEHSAKSSTAGKSPAHPDADHGLRPPVEPDSDKAQSKEHRGLGDDFTLELGQGKVPKQLERLFHMMAVDSMKDVLGEDRTFGEEEGAKSLNVAANLSALAQAEAGQNIGGISAEQFRDAVSWDEKAGKLEIKDHDRLNEIISDLNTHADELWEQGVLQKGAAAYLDNIRTDTWEDIVQAKGLEDRVKGHDGVDKEQIQDFKKSAMVQEAKQAIQDQLRQAEEAQEEVDKIIQPEAEKDPVVELYRDVYEKSGPATGQGSLDGIAPHDINNAQINPETPEGKEMAGFWARHREYDADDIRLLSIVKKSGLDIESGALLGAYNDLPRDFKNFLRYDLKSINEVNSPLFLKQSRALGYLRLFSGDKSGIRDLLRSQKINLDDVKQRPSDGVWVYRDAFGRRGYDLLIGKNKIGIDGPGQESWETGGAFRPVPAKPLDYDSINEALDKLMDIEGDRSAPAAGEAGAIAEASEPAGPTEDISVQEQAKLYVQKNTMPNKITSKHMYMLELENMKPELRQEIRDWVEKGLDQDDLRTYEKNNLTNMQRALEAMESGLKQDTEEIKEVDSGRRYVDRADEQSRRYVDRADEQAKK